MSFLGYGPLRGHCPLLPSTNVLRPIVSSILSSLKSYLFLAALGLCCCVRAFFSCGEQGLLSSCGAQASSCGAFSCCRVWALGCQTPVVVASELQSTGSVVVLHGLSCSVAHGILLDQGSNPCPLQGRFLTTGPPGKPYFVQFSSCSR